MATKLFKKNGYGQVEPTHLSAQKTGQILSTKVNETVSVLENGAFLKLDGTTSGAGEFLLVFNEIKNYRSDEIGYKDFAIKKDQQLNNEIYTRLFKVNDNDYFVTNMIKFDNITGDATHATVTNPTTKYFEVKTDSTTGYGVLEEVASGSLTNGVPYYQIMEATTLPDGQEAYKVRRVGITVKSS